MLLRDDRRYKTLALSAVFLAISVIISFVEGMSGINALIPLPGVKLGLSNIAITACLYLVSKMGAFVVAFIRPVFLFLFSSNPISFVMSFSGSLLAFVSLLITKKLYGKVFSFAGVSCISAVFHSVGQLAAAMIIMRDVSLVYYLPVFVIASSLTGTLCGIVMNMILPRLSKTLSQGNLGGIKA